MMISFYRTAIIFALIVVFSGCSWFGQNEPEYVASAEYEPLKIPAGLDTPQGSSPPVVISSPGMRKPVGDELEPKPPLVANTAGRKESGTYMAWSADGVYLLVKDTPESVVRRLRYAIERSGMRLIEADDSGAHKFHYQQTTPDDGFFSNMAFWRDKPFNFSGTFMTSIRPDGDNTRVYLLFGTGEAVDTAGAEHVLGIFMDRLG